MAELGSERLETTRRSESRWAMGDRRYGRGWDGALKWDGANIEVKLPDQGGVTD